MSDKSNIRVFHHDEPSDNQTPPEQLDSPTLSPTNQPSTDIPASENIPDITARSANDEHQVKTTKNKRKPNSGKRADAGGTHNKSTKDRKPRKIETRPRGRQIPYVIHAKPDGKLNIVLDMESKKIEIVQLDNPDSCHNFTDDRDGDFKCYVPYLCSDENGISDFDDNHAPILRLIMLRENGEFTTGFLHYTSSIFYEGIEYGGYDCSIKPLYEDDADDFFDRISTETRLERCAHISEENLPHNHQLTKPLCLEVNKSSTKIARNSHLDDLRFEETEDYFERRGPKFLYSNPEAVDAFQLIPLTDANRDTLRPTIYRGLVESYENTIGRNQIPEGLHSLAVGNHCNAAVILNTAKPKWVKGKLDIAKQLEQLLESDLTSDERHEIEQSDVYVDAMRFAGDWSDIKATASRSETGIHNYFILGKDLSKQVFDRHVIIVEGLNDAAALYSEWMKLDKDIIIATTSTCRFHEKVVNALDPYIDWSSCTFTIFMDKLKYSESARNNLVRLTGVDSSACMLAQNIFPDLVEGEDPDEYVSRSDFSKPPQDFHKSLSSTTPIRKNWGIDPEQSYAEFSEIESAFWKLQPQALLDCKMIDEIITLPATGVIDPTIYNEFPPEMKAFVYLSAFNNQCADLSVTKKKDEQRVISKFFDDELFQRAQGHCTKCKVALIPLAGHLPDSYFEYIQMGAAARALWSKHNGNLEAIWRDSLVAYENIRAVSKQKNIIFDEHGNGNDIIEQSLYKRSQEPSVRYVTASLGSGKTLAVQEFSVRNAISHMHENYRAVAAIIDGSHKHNAVMTITRDYANSVASATKSNSSDSPEQKREILDQWFEQIRPAIESIPEGRSFVGLGLDLSIMQVVAASNKKIADILESLYGVIPFESPAIIQAVNNRDLDQMHFVHEILRIDNSTVKALNQSNIEDSPIRSESVNRLPCPTITHARFNQNRFPTYKGILRLCVSDERFKRTTESISPDVLEEILELLENTDHTATLLFERHVAIEHSTDPEELPKIYEGNIHTLTYKLSIRCQKVISSLSYTEDDSRTQRQRKRHERSLWKKLIVSITNNQTLCDSLFEIPNRKDWHKHNQELTDFCDKLAEFIIIAALNQSDIPVINGEPTQVPPITHIQHLISGTINEYVILDATADVLNNELESSYEHWRAAYPAPTKTQVKKILSNTTIIQDTIPLVGSRNLQGGKKTSLLSYIYPDTDELRTVTSNQYLSCVHSLLKSRRLLFLEYSLENSNSEVNGLKSWQIEQNNNVRDYIYNVRLVLAQLSKLTQKRHLILQSCEVEQLTNFSSLDEKPSINVDQDRIISEYKSNRIILEVKNVTSSGQRENVFFSSIAEAAALTYAHSLQTVYERSYLGIIDEFINYAWHYYKFTGQMTLLFAYQKSGKNYVNEGPADENGNKTRTETIGHHIEGIFGPRQKLYWEDRNLVNEISLDDFSGILFPLGHLTSEAIGSNRYRDYGQVIVIDEPYVPEDATTANAGISGHGSTPEGEMTSNIIQAIGRCRLRKGSISHSEPFKVMFFDVGGNTVEEFRKFIEDRTNSVNHVRSNLIDIAKTSVDTDMLNLLISGYNISGSRYDKLTARETEVVKTIIQERFDMSQAA